MTIELFDDTLGGSFDPTFHAHAGWADGAAAQQLRDWNAFVAAAERESKRASALRTSTQVVGQSSGEPRSSLQPGGGKRGSGLHKDASLAAPSSGGGSSLGLASV
jgi:hypothetical protein